MNGDITVNLPIELVESGLSVEEIGAIFVLFSLKNLPDEKRKVLEVRDDVVVAGKKLIKRGIVRYEKDDDGVEMIIDITETIKNDKEVVCDIKELNNLTGLEFWGDESKEDVDGNSVFCHKEFKAFPKLKNDVVVYEIFNGILLIGETYRDCLDEAKEVVIAYLESGVNRE